MIQTDFSLSNSAIDNRDSILMDIHKEGINIAIYERNIEALLPEIAVLMKETFEYHASGTPAEICGALQDDFSRFFSGRSELIEDIAAQVKRFGEVTKTSSFRLLLATVNTNMCRRFHTDMNDIRMLCTYSGPGTLWLTEDNVDREALNTSAGNEGITKDAAAIQQAQTGSVVLLKGAIYPQQGTKAIVHRSPTIEESGEKRLLLRIDTNDFLGFLNE